MDDPLSQYSLIYDMTNGIIPRCISKYRISYFTLCAKKAGRYVKCFSSDLCRHSLTIKS